MVEIRPEASSDAEGIRKVHSRTFPTSAEADLVEQLRSDGAAAVSLVATDGGAIVGHILFSPMRVEADGRELRALGLAPVAVLPERQGEGIGSALVEQGLREARSLGIDIVFLVGEPDYYGRFGFRPETARPFDCRYAGQYFQAKALSDDFGAPVSGSAEYAAAFAELG